MNNTYTLKSKSITEVLNAIDTFNSKMELFKEKHNNYTHEAALISIDDIWNGSFTIKHEQDNTVL